jgi:hypothetical protein
MPDTSIQYRRVLFTDVALATVLKTYSAGHFRGFIRIFYNLSKNDYYLISLRKELSTKILNTSVISEN